MITAELEGERLIKETNLKPDTIMKSETLTPSGRGWQKELAMAGKSTQKENRVVPPPKRYWHLYSLQNLQTHKLTEIVNKVLRREYVLIK